MCKIKGFFMRKSFIFAALALSCTALQVQATETGVVHFTGQITASTCEITQGSGAGADDQTVTLNTADSGDFGTNIGDIAAVSRVNFQINIEKCTTSLGSMNVAFDGANSTATDTALAVIGGATGVGISIYRDGVTEPVNFTTDRNDAKTTAVALADITANEGGAHTFNYSAAYVRTAATITEGAANADANYVLAYY